MKSVSAMLSLAAMCLFVAPMGFSEHSPATPGTVEIHSSPVPTVIMATAPSIDPSLQQEAQAAMDRAARWLSTHQSDDGSWSNPEFPALTGLPVWALARHGGYPDAVNQGVKYILTCVHDDGSIYRTPSEERKGGGLANYNTAICMVALHATGRPDLNSTVQKARQYVAGTQHFGDDIYRGGMGYDASTGRAYADLSNSYLAYEAMRLTQGVEDLRKEGEPAADLDWQAAIEFVESIQNRPESNEQPWASDSPEEYGGFAYRPDQSMAGSYTNSDGAVRLRSYGSMTYAGLLSFIYAQVDKSDPRVQSAVDWATKHWTLEENPGMGAEGLYYYYHTLAKALAVYGQDLLDRPDATRINWRQDLIRKLVSLQKTDPDTGAGYWMNEANRWWESDPVLVTAYALLALQAAVNQ